MKKTIILLLFEILAPQAIAWENELTHPAITQEAAERSVLAGDYLQTQLGLNEKLNANLELTEQYKSNLIRRAGQVSPFPVLWNENELSIKEWLRVGSKFEDIPNPRARHHFYDPIYDMGLNNAIVEPFSDIHGLIIYGSGILYPDYWPFNLMGSSAANRALGRTESWEPEWESEPEYLLKYNWPTARDLFYYAIVSEQKEERKKLLGSMFLVLGHICHLLEDQGVPAHTRNDFLWGHLVGHNYKKETGVKDFWKIGGNPFEGWMEEQIKNNGGNIPGQYLDRLMEYPPVFDSFMGYWDTGICEESGETQWRGDTPGWPTTSFGYPPADGSWGLAECTNYQFLSHSTIFRNWTAPGQYFPHPAKEHTRVDWYPTGPDGERQYYRAGYDVPHLTRSSLTAYLLGDLAFWDTDTTEEKKVYEDYAKRTISRTVDYTTGLLNYFFRGKLSIEQTDCNNGKIIITITNKSDNSGMGQILKGGTFALYWDDLSGNRTPVTDFTVYQPGTETLPGNEWNGSTLMNYDETTKAVLTPPESNDVNYILVYEGIISSSPDSPDTDDTHQIATGVQALCSSCCGTTSWCSCEYITGDCAFCNWFATGKTPRYLAVKFEGVLKCDDSSLSEINGTYCLEYRRDPLRDCSPDSWSYGHEGSTPIIGFALVQMTNPDYKSIYLYVAGNESPYGKDWFFWSTWGGNGCNPYDLPPWPPTFDCSLKLPLQISNLAVMFHCLCCGEQFGCYGGKATIYNPCENPCANSTIWESSHNYIVNNKVKLSGLDNFCYKCYVSHLSDSTNMPGSGTNWQDYWMLIDIGP